MTTALIDGDIIIHKCSVVMDTPISHEGEGLYKFDLKNAVKNAKGIVKKIRRDTKADRVIFVVSDKENFRKKINPEYKGNRKGRKPIIFNEVKEALLEWDEVEGISKPELEADDVLGILGTGNFKSYPGEMIICTTDKDLQTVPGKHFNWDKHDSFFDGDYRVVTEEEADRAFYRQTLTGDRGDGYPGCPGMGPKTADKVLDRKGFCWETIVSEYEKQGLSEEDALMNARMARILRAEDYDVKKGEVQLWTP